MIAESADLLASPWRFQAHVEVWLLVAAVVGSWIYAVRVLGPRLASGRPATTPRQRRAFVAAVLILWLASDWPIHDVSEEYLYSVHMFQHMALSYFMPPLVLLATPDWLFRAVLGEGALARAVRWMGRPVPAGLTFNVVVMVTHIPALVNRSVTDAPLHYGLHVAVVVSALFMWLPVCGPDPAMHVGYGGRMIYLFLMSVVPTVPAGWLTFAEGVVYRHYDIPVRVWGLSATIDQQLAGAVMKVGGGIFLWTIVGVMFFRRFAASFSREQSYVRGDASLPDVLTVEHVTDAFGRVPPAPEPQRR
jgi:putative membrane protein